MMTMPVCAPAEDAGSSHVPGHRLIGQVIAGNDWPDNAPRWPSFFGETV